MNAADHTMMLRCREWILEALLSEATKRKKNPDTWIDNERRAVAAAANDWASAHGSRSERVSVADVERIEVRAVGHVDYASKLALYLAEAIYAPKVTP